MSASLLRFTLASVMPYKGLDHLKSYFYFSTQVSVAENTQIRQLFKVVILVLFMEAIFTKLGQIH